MPLSRDQPWGKTATPPTMKIIRWTVAHKVILLIIKRKMRRTLTNSCRCRTTRRALIVTTCMMIAKETRMIRRAFMFNRILFRFLRHKRSYLSKLMRNCPTTWRAARVAREIPQSWNTKKNPRTRKISPFINRLQTISKVSQVLFDSNLNWPKMADMTEVKSSKNNRIKLLRSVVIRLMAC